jgi:hypothetical protein
LFLLALSLLLKQLNFHFLFVHCDLGLPKFFLFSRVVALHVEKHRREQAQKLRDYLSLFITPSFPIILTVHFLDISL